MLKSSVCSKNGGALVCYKKDKTKQKMIRILIGLTMLVAASSPVYLQAQEFVDLKYENYDYGDFVGAVRFHVEGLRTSFPIADLAGQTRLSITFDDLDGGVRDYYYSIIHCDRDWHPSELNTLEYLDGYTEDRILNFQFSNKTLQEYTQYSFTIPNPSMRWTKSGNYLLVVFEKDNDYYPVFTRRFIVAERAVPVTPRLTRPSQPSKMRTHQEIDFTANFEQFPLRNPQQDVVAVVLQNGRWDTAIDGVKPLFVRGNELLFDYQNKIVFPAMKEFRFLDLRSLRYISQNIANIERLPGRWEVTLMKDQPRDGQPYIEYEDLNGDFIIETQDQTNQMAADYAQVLFTFYAPEPFYDSDLYLMGTFSNWQPHPRFKMQYNQAVNGYVLKRPLKQGFYNYAYGLLPTSNQPRTRNGDDKAPTPPVDFALTEGNFFETENNYLILLYFHPFGARYDQVIGFVQFSTN